MTTPVNFLEVLKTYRSYLWPLIEAELDKFFHCPDFCQVSPKYQSLVDFHRHLIEEYPRRLGKYVRPTLIFLTAQAMGSKKELAINTAAAMQLSEDWILNHDDIEDNSLQRRGSPALHRLYGKELATNAGDALHVLMWHVLRENQNLIGEKLTFAILDEFNTMLNRTVLGQTIEIKWFQENKADLTDDDILLILESKTGYYTISGPMRLGAILAGASTDQLNHLYNFGKYLGYCFQIQDDLLDLTSDFSGLKKQTGNDIYEGKRTLMLLHLFRNAKGKDLKKLTDIMAKSREEKTATDVTWVITKMGEYGSLDHGRQLIDKFIKEAKDYFSLHLDFLSTEPYRSQLLSFVNFLSTRDH